MADPQRPSNVPADAWWSPNDNEWILGAKDALGRLQGEVTYWRPDGSLVCKCDHVDGKPHGVSRRFHETGEVAQHCFFEHGELHGLRSWFMTAGHTTEKPRAAGIDAKVWHGELDYVHGRVAAFRYFDRSGIPVGVDGTPLPAQPPGVPANASRNKAGDWVTGTWDEQGKQVGLHRFWNERGVLTSEEDHVDTRTVRITNYRSIDGTRLAMYALHDKRLAGDAAAYRRDGAQCVRAHFDGAAVIDHLGDAGLTVRSTSYAAATDEQPPPAPNPTDEDQLVLDAIADGDDSAVEVATALSPVGMAYAIAAGWGGDSGRTATEARRHRALARKVAPPRLQEVFASLHMDRMPRMQTPLRVDAVLRGLAADTSVDARALRDALIARGGPAAMLALSDPPRAAAYLRSRHAGDTLRLANLGLPALPPAIGRFWDVSHLYAEGNRLTTLPDEVGDMFQLARLNLANNRIASLPRTLAWLPFLRTLYLTDNDLAAIPPMVLELSELRTLSIGDNELTSIPDAIGDMPSLDDLSLYGNKLRDLPASLARCPLTFLHLGDHQWAEPPDVIGRIKTLRTLWIASPALERLPAAICRLPELRELMLWYSNVSSVPDELYEMTQLTELRIKNNPLPERVYARLAEALPNTRIY